MKKLKELKDKTKNFITKHKKGVLIVGTLGLAYIGKALITKHNDDIATEAFKAGSRITGLAMNTATVEAVGVDKAAEIIKKSDKIGDGLMNSIEKSDMTLRQFNKMYENEVFGFKNVFDKTTK